MRVLIRSVSAIFLVLFVTAGHAQIQPSQSKPQPKAPTTAPKQAAPAKEPAQEEAIPPAAPGALFPAVVARINGKAILGRDLEQRVQAQLATIGNPPWNNLREDYRSQLTTESLGALIATELLSQKAAANGIKPTDAEIQAEFTKVAKTFSSDAEMNTQLANRGMDRTALTREITRGLVVAKYVDENITKKITISPADAQQYYSAHTDEFRHPDMIRTSHILILVPEGATAEQDRTARARATALLARVKKGEDFAKLAKENSMDGSASQGGDIGFAPKGDMAPEYEDAAYALPVGGISDLVRTQFGYHIIKVTDKKKEGVSTLDEVRNQLMDFLKNQKVQEETEKHVIELRKAANVEILIPLGTSGTSGDATASSPRP